MSSVDHIGTLTVPAGEDRISAVALDGLLALLTSRINHLIIAMGRLRDADDTLKDGCARWRTFSARAKVEIESLVEYLSVLYEESGATRWSDLPVPDGVAYTAAGSDWFSGFTADPASLTWTVTLPGEAAARYRLRMLVRHLAAEDPTQTIRISLSGSRSEVLFINDEDGPQDDIVEADVQGGDVLTIEFDAGTSFSSLTALPADSDRFPYRPRYRASGAFQFDWLGFVPLTSGTYITEDGDVLITEDGFPLFWEDA